MKRLKDLNISLHRELKSYDIKPSQLRRMNEAFDSAHFIYPSIYQICCRSEDQLRTEMGLVEEDIEVIKCFLKQHGLSLGMTEEEVVAYEDAEYYERHPEELDILLFESQQSQESLRRVPIEEEIVSIKSLSEADEEDQEPKIPLLTVELKQRILDHYDEVTRKNIENDIYTYGYLADREFLKTRIFRILYESQPWYYRWICPNRKRIACAKAEADFICERRKEEIISTIVEKKRADKAEEIESLWEDNWKIYLKDIGLYKGKVNYPYYPYFPKL